MGTLRTNLLENQRVKRRKRRKKKRRNLKRKTRRKRKRKKRRRRRNPKLSLLRKTTRRRKRRRSPRNDLRPKCFKNVLPHAVAYVIYVPWPTHSSHYALSCDSSNYFLP